MTVFDKGRLESELLRIDGKGYPAYKDIKGAYDFGNYILYIDHVQGDPFAAPSRIRLRTAGTDFPREFSSNWSRRIACEDYITRALGKAISRISRGHRGSGRSGAIFCMRCGQQVLERTSVRLTEHWVEARLRVGLPADGRRVLGRQARDMFFSEIQEIASSCLFYAALDKRALQRAADLYEDQEAVREALDRLGLVAFVADGAVLARESGVSDLPMSRERAVAFKTPDTLRVTINTPHSGPVTGMGIPRGVTIIVGGGYHGKSTLLRALERGVYNHIPGDGREMVITERSATKVRAEDGRRIEKVDISPFINGLPSGEDTTVFCTENASGSTSQAANIMEALEAGAKTLLMDEDTCATNFMIRDEYMQRLVSDDKEPITPFLCRVRELYETLGVSTVLVMGGSGLYLGVADTVIMCENYRVLDVSAQARRIGEEVPNPGRRVRGRPLVRPAGRIPLPESFNPYRGRKVKITERGGNMVFGEQEVVLSCIEQIVDPGQVRALGDLIHYLSENMFDGRTSLSEGIFKAYKEMERSGLEMLSPFSAPEGDYAMPRPEDVLYAISRMRSLKVFKGGDRT
ncbi:MAG: ABC-ATPase domain-containing protein [Bacillota bacterium]